MHQSPRTDPIVYGFGCKNKHGCPFCNHRMKDKNDMIRHIRIHTGDKPYKCTNVDCSYRSAQNSDLKKHQTTCKKRKFLIDF